MTLRPDPKLPEKHLPIGESTWTFEARGHVQFRLLYGHTAEGKPTETHVLAEAPQIGPGSESTWRQLDVPRTPELVRGSVVLHYPAPLISGWLTISQDFGRHRMPLTYQEFYRFPGEPRVLDVGWEKWAGWDGWPRTSSMTFSTTHTNDGEFRGDGHQTVRDGGEAVLHEWSEGSLVTEGKSPGAYVRLVVRRIPDDRVRALTMVSGEYESFVGEWSIEQAFERGKPVEQHKGKRFRFHASRSWDSEVYGEAASDYRLDPTTPVKQITLDVNGKAMLGIYERDGDTLRLCWRDDVQRPTAIDKEAVLYVLKQVK